MTSLPGTELSAPGDHGRPLAVFPDCCLTLCQAFCSVGFAGNNRIKNRINPVIARFFTFRVPAVICLFDFFMSIIVTQRRARGRVSGLQGSRKAKRGGLPPARLRRSTSLEGPGQVRERKRLEVPVGSKPGRANKYRAKRQEDDALPAFFAGFFGRVSK